MEHISINDISHFLISNSYLLTALELDFELIERGMENKILRSFFTNPENFENVSSNVELPTNRIKASPSISTIDSIDFAKYSDDGLQQSDERIKVLEFELRKKNDEVRKLREELTLISTSKNNTSFVVDWIPESSENNENCETNATKSLMAHENRALNFLINDYLLQHGFKLTAVSFSEEIVDQDLDSWDDVGINIPKLPSLECFILSKRSIIEETSSKNTLKPLVLNDLDSQTDPLDQELLDHYINSNKELQNTIDLLKMEMEMENIKYEKLDYTFQEQTKLLAHLKKELNDVRGKLICTQRDLMYESAKRKVINSGGNHSISDLELKSETISILSDAVNDINNCENTPIKDNYLLISQNKYDSEKLESDGDGGIVTNILEEIVTQRNPTPAFIKALALFTDDNQVENKLVNLVDSLDQFVSLVTDILPNLFEAIQDKNNPDLIMLLVQCTCLNSDSKVREKLLRFLINLYPEPSIFERTIIMKQVQILSGYLGAFRIEAELITQIWELLYEKPKLNCSKRILLANICGIISPLAPANLRSSLILSIHQQMLEEESDPVVVYNIISSIASTIPHLEDVDKISLCVQIIANYLWKCDSVIDYKKNNLDSSLSVEEVVKSKLLPAVAQWCLDAGMLHTSLIFNILISMKNVNLNILNIDYHEIWLHLNIIQLLIPFIDVWIKLSTPKITDDDDDQRIDSKSVQIFDDGKLMDLYRIDLIIDADKYKEIHKSFLNYTGKSILKSLISSPSKQSTENNESIQCWTPWPELMWLQAELIIPLICLLKNVRPKVETVDLNDPHVISDLAKNQFTIVPLKSKELCIKIAAIFFELGCRFSSSVINSVFIPCFSRYLFESSDKGVDCNLKSDAIGTGIVSGYCALLAALAQLDSNPFVLDSLKKFLTNVSFLVAAESLPLDGVRLAIDVLCSEFGNVTNTSLMILASLQPCIACPNASVRIFVCLMLQELLIQLSSLQQVEDQVFVGILNSLQNMIYCSYESVKVMTIGPFVSLIQAKSISLSTCTQVFHCLSKLMDDSVSCKPDLVETFHNISCTEILITTLIQMINVVGPTCPDNFKDEAILPWLLGITEINNQTKDIPRRSGIAMILYSTFSTLSYYLISSNSLETCLLPALDRLKLDMIELYPENVKEVESMSHEIRKRIESRQKSNSDITHNVKSKISGLNFMTRTANVTSSATSSILGKFKDLKDSNFSSKSDDGIDQVSTTKTNITNFFSKRR